MRSFSQQLGLSFAPGLLLLMLLPLVLLHPAPARASSAAADEAFDRKGWTISMSAAYLRDISRSGYTNFDENGWGLEVTGGFRFSPFIGAEFQIEYLDSFEGVSFGPRFEYFLLTGRIQPFLSMGVSAFNGESDDRRRHWGGLWRPGVGLDWYVTPNVVIDLSAEYIYGFGSFDDLRQVRVSLGPEFRF